MTSGEQCPPRIGARRSGVCRLDAADYFDLASPFISIFSGENVSNAPRPFGLLRNAAPWRQVIEDLDEQINID